MTKLPDNCDSCAYVQSEYAEEYKTTVLHCSHPEGRDLERINPFIRHKRCPIPDDILNGKRYRVRYRENDFYFIVLLKDEMPCEIFVEYPIQSDPSLDYMMSAWDAFTRLATMALKAYSLEKVIRQIKKSSRRKRDLPGITATILEGWL